MLYIKVYFEKIYNFIISDIYKLKSFRESNRYYKFWRGEINSKNSIPSLVKKSDS